MSLLEPNYYGLWIGKQTAKGTPNTAPSKRLVQVGGNVVANRDDGEENYSDLGLYGNRTDWVNTISGSGEPVLEATPDELAYLLWLYHGSEVVTSVTGPPAAQQHRFTPSPGLGFYASVHQRVGQSTIRRERFADALVTRLTIEASVANKAMRVTPRLISLDPGAKVAADPTQDMPTDRPFLFTDAAVNAGATSDGSIIIDGTTFRGSSQFTLTLESALELVYGDSVFPYDVQQGTAAVTVAVTMLLDPLAYAQWNKLAYGTATPAAGTKPLASIPALGSFFATFRQRNSAGAFNGRQFSPSIPGVKWAVPDAPGPNPDGGSTELALSGSMRVVAGQQPYTLDVLTASGTTAFTV